MVAHLTPAPAWRHRFLLACFTVVVASGIFFRVFHIDWKLYGFDETVTSLRATGHTLDDFEALIYDGRAHSIQELLPLQAPSSSTTLESVWNSLAREDPQHPPAYFVITSFAGRLLGDSLIVRRLPAVIFGLLVIPASAWLAYELFGTAFAACAMALLVAISPYQVAFAQQAREYSLWSLLTALSSVVLLRALKGGGAVLWIVYGALVAAGFWSDTLFGLVALAHALYAAVVPTGFPPRRRLAAIGAIVAGAVAFAPWILVIVRGRDQALADMPFSATPLSPALYAGKFLFNFGTLFFDLDYVRLFLFPVALLAIAICLWCCIVLVRKTDVRTWSFVLLLGAVNAIPFVLPDLLLHQTRAIESRYLTVTWLALQLATAFSLSFAAASANRTLRRTSWSMLAFLSVAGFVSCSIASEARTWWVAGGEFLIPAVAGALANKPSATLVYVGDPDILFELLPSARPDLRFQLHRTLDRAALASAQHPFVISRPSVLGGLKLGHDLAPVTLPLVFPSQQDQSIANLHRSAAAMRSAASSSTQPYDRDQLYAATAGL